MIKTAVSIALSGACALASANTITYTLSGVIKSSPTAAVQVGSDFTFVASVDSAATPVSPAYAGRTEWAMLTDARLTIGASTVTVDPASGAVALDEYSGSPRNFFILNEYSLDAPDTALRTTGALDTIRIYDVTASLANRAAPGKPFQTTAAPTTFLGSLSDWSYANLTFSAFGQDNKPLGDVSGDITSFSVASVSSVPEPQDAGLFALGLAGIGLIARRQRRAATV